MAKAKAKSLKERIMNAVRGHGVDEIEAALVDVATALGAGESRQLTGLARVLSSSTDQDMRLEPTRWDVFLGEGRVRAGEIRLSRGTSTDRLVAVPEMGMVTQHPSLDEAAKAVAGEQRRLIVPRRLADV